MHASRPIVLIIGPTAAGKTTLAIELARRLPGGAECICADSMQVYRGMDIGTAKPTAAEQAAVPHHVLDVADPAVDGFSVDTWLELAEDAIERIRGRGAYAIVVGGTSLYIQTFLEGLIEGPAPDPELRARLADADEQTLRAWLERVDPAGADRIHQNDRKRTIRAIEVHELTGRPLSEQQGNWSNTPPRADIQMIGLDYAVPALNRRINARVRDMLDAGLVEEVRRLHAAGSLGGQASEAVGYRQIIDALENRVPLDEAIEKIKIRTRRLGKHQRTWIRRFRQHPRSLWLQADELDQETIVNKALSEITAWAATGA